MLFSSRKKLRAHHPRTLAAIVALAALLSSCGAVVDSEFTTNSTDKTSYEDKSVVKVEDDVIDHKRKKGPLKRFFSKENLRDVDQDRDAFADLETDSGPGIGRRIDARKVNRRAATRQQVDFVGTLRNDDGDEDAQANEQRKNLRELKQAGAKKFKPGERVRIRFDNDPLTFAVDQLLGGLLSVNYVAASPLEGTVSFETRTPILKSQVPTILRDILAGRGLAMKLINGVYQIGTPALIQQLEATAAVGNSAELSTKVIKLKRGNVTELAEVVAQILPTGATVNPVPTDGALVVRASAVDLPSVTNLINTLVETGVAEDLIAIVPLKESPPEQVAASVLSYYENARTPQANVPVVIPLENQQSLLIGARNRRIMNNVRTLVRGLDRDLRDAASLRIIPLKHLPAEEIAAQLNAIFGSGNANPNTQLDQQPQANRTETTTTTQNDTTSEQPSRVRAPATIRSSNDRGLGSPNARRFEQRQAAANPLADAGPINQQPQEGISIVPDNRNNALLIFATFKQFKRIREVVRALDLPLAQVVIEATIVEVDINDNLGYGVQFFLNSRGINVRSSTTPTPADPGTAGLVATGTFNSFGSAQVNVVLDALQSVTDVRIISSPYLTVLDGRAARLSIGDQVPFLTSSTDAQDNGTTTTTNQIEVRDTGIILEVTPRVGADNSVLLNVSQEVSSVQPGGADANILTPVIQQRSINSDIVVRSGKTALLGGLIQDTKTKTTTGVPVVSKIPVLGNLFKQTQNDLGRTELLVMITPRVVRKPSQLENITRQLRSNLSNTYGD